LTASNCLPHLPGIGSSSIRLVAVLISLVFTVLLIAGVIAIGVAALLLLLRMLVRRPMQQRS
jgi:hypothetical protein